MSKYFYTDPLAAAWMGKHFGMVFFTPEDDDYQEEVYGWEGVAGAFDYDGAERVYVHPDSLHLLEPQFTDRLCDREGCDFFQALNDPLRIEHARRLIAKGWKIESRDGKAFHWPECGAE